MTVTVASAESDKNLVKMTTFPLRWFGISRKTFWYKSNKNAAFVSVRGWCGSSNNPFPHVNQDVTIYSQQHTWSTMASWHRNALCIVVWTFGRVVRGKLMDSLTKGQQWGSLMFSLMFSLAKTVELAAIWNFMTFIGRHSNEFKHKYRNWTFVWYWFISFILVRMKKQQQKHIQKYDTSGRFY